MAESESQPTSGVPFAHHAGVDVLEIGAGTGRARMPDRPELRNHIQSLHAGALFTLGETASGSAMLGAFGPVLGSVRPVTRRAEITYRKIARGPIEARAALERPADELLAMLEEKGRVDFDVTVTLANEAGDTVGEMVVTWNLAKITS
jgi:acyl-coenzyme A thioesterase PaaI-like protein